MSAIRTSATYYNCTTDQTGAKLLSKVDNTQVHLADLQTIVSNALATILPFLDAGDNLTITIESQHTPPAM